MLCLGLDVGGTRVKAALLLGGQSVATAVSPRYRRPSASALLELITAAAAELAEQGGRPEALGLCVPGALDEARRRVAFSANLPALQEIELAEIASAIGAPRHRVVTDQIAAATDYAFAHKVRGRLLAISIGTGVGAAVLDCDERVPLGHPLLVNGDSPGHIGQMDVSLDDRPPVGADGGAGSLEAYIGAAALAGRDPRTLDRDSVAIRALIRALRICHALYRPNQIVLLGGVGIRLAHLREPIDEAVRDHLTRLARPGWRLGFGDDDFHAARGAARLA